MARIFIISTTLPQFCYREHTRLIMIQTRVPLLRIARRRGGGGQHFH